MNFVLEKLKSAGERMVAEKKMPKENGIIIKPNAKTYEKVKLKRMHTEDSRLY